MLDAEEDDDMSLVESFLNDSQRESESIVQVSISNHTNMSMMDYYFVKNILTLRHGERHHRHLEQFQTPCLIITFIANVTFELGHWLRLI